MTLNKVLDTFTCAAIRVIILDLVPGLDAHSFTECFTRFVNLRACPNFAILDGGKKFVCMANQKFVSSLRVDWHVNLPLAKRYWGFFERLLRSTKSVLKKQLQTQRLSYDKLQIILSEMETILNNRPLTHYYAEEAKTCLTSNHVIREDITISTSRSYRRIE